MKKILALALALCMIFALAACGQSAAPAATEAAPAEEAAPAAEAAPAEEAAVVKIGMVTDVGGVNDKSFNQTSWEGLQALAAEDPTSSIAPAASCPPPSPRPTALWTSWFPPSAQRSRR